MLQSTWRVFECSRPQGEGTMLQSLGLCFECSRSRGEGTMLQIKCRAIVSLTKGILVSISCWSLMQYTMKDVGRETDGYDVLSRATLLLPLVLRKN